MKRLKGNDSKNTSFSNYEDFNNILELGDQGNILARLSGRPKQVGHYGTIIMKD